MNLLKLIAENDIIIDNYGTVFTISIYLAKYDDLVNSV